MKLLSCLFIGTILTLTLLGCGQTGNLYLPKDAPKNSTHISK